MTEMAVARVPESSAEERAPTGLPELDGMLEGGFLTGSLITLTGRPGTGKTIFGSHFLYHGAKQAKQSGMYVSMLESEKSYLHNVRRIGLDFGPLMAQKRFAFLELPAPTAEGLPALWEQIAREIDENQTERLVIDSFTAMSPAFQTVGDLRTLMPPSLPGGTLRGRCEVGGCPPDHTPSCWTLTACIIRWVPPSGSSRERLAR